MENVAGIVRFDLPPSWRDCSSYHFVSQDRRWSLTLQFDHSIEEPSALEALNDRLALAQSVLSGFHLESIERRSFSRSNVGNALLL